MPLLSTINFNKQVEGDNNINLLHLKILSFIDRAGEKKKQAENTPRLYLILYNLWTETEIKRLTVSLVCF